MCYGLGHSHDLESDRLKPSGRILYHREAFGVHGVRESGIHQGINGAGVLSDIVPKMAIFESHSLQVGKVGGSDLHKIVSHIIK